MQNWVLKCVQIASYVLLMAQSTTILSVLEVFSHVSINTCRTVVHTYIDHCVYSCISLSEL